MGSDTLYGGTGTGTGTDRFIFDTTPNSGTNIDAIKDFKHGSDRAYLENAVFKGLGKATGKLKDKAF